MQDPTIWRVIEQLEELEQSEDLPEGLWHISRDTGMWMNLMLRHSGATRILEIGTSSGYSGLFLADAAKSNGGQLTTCEYSPYKIELAKTSFENAGLMEYVQLLEGDALQSVESLEGPFDFVFIDAIKEEYLFYLSMVWNKVRPGGLIVADNMLSHQGIIGISAYQGMIGLMEDASTVTLPIGSGVEMTTKII
jgi:caffeoyl-CoA O-methyltransferase